MIKAHKIRLDPNNKQASHLLQACGVSRFAFNWGLRNWIDQYAAHEIDEELPRPSHFALKKQLNAIKRVEFPWMMKVTKCAPESAFEDLNKAYQNFFKKNAKRPNFKKRGKAKDSFRLNNLNFKIDGRRIRIPNLGWVKMREELRFAGKLISATISKSSNQWFASVTVETSDREFSITEQSTGIDLGITNLAILSNGEVSESPKFHRVELKRIRKLNKELSRRTKFSKNWYKTKRNLANLHAKVARQRSDHMHKLTTNIADRFNIIGMETLNVAGMVKNRKLARAISDQSFGEFKRQMQYKCEDRKTSLIEVDSWFPSSKNCSDCGFKNQELTLKDRAWTCGNCGSYHDRDINAAINIKNEALRILNETTAGYAGIVCGDGSSGEGVFKSPGVKLLSVKQESNTGLLMAIVGEF